MRRLLLIIPVALSLIVIAVFAQTLHTLDRSIDPPTSQAEWQVFNAWAAQPGISGIVNLGGVPMSTISVDLLFLVDGNEWISDTVSTQPDGSYQFSKVAALNPGEAYQVSFNNPYLDPQFLAFWYTPKIETYSANDSVQMAPFDIENIPQLYPPDNFTATLPVTFTWTARHDITDSYQLHIMNIFGEDYYSPLLPYTDHIRLDTLPIELSYDELYYWEMVVYSPDGGNGVNTDFFGIQFTDPYEYIYLPLLTR